MTDVETRPQYPIRTAARRTGLSPHVLRAWERRYGVVDPARPEGGRRLYSNADILRFRVLRQLTQAGHSIGQIARLPMAELLRLLQQEGEASEDAPVVESTAETGRYLAAALAAVEGMDDRQLHATLMRAVVALSAREFVSGVTLPLLQQVGRLWEEGGICPAHEHLLSVQMGRVLGWLSATIPVADDARRAIAVTPAGQRHEFGALLAAVAAAEEGWRVTYLGPDLPARDIATAARALGAELILLSAVLGAEPATLLRELEAIRGAVGAGPRIVVGGRGAEGYRAEVARAGGEWLPDLDALRRALREGPQKVVAG